jgi:hypothetical protein
MIEGLILRPGIFTPAAPLLRRDQDHKGQIRPHIRPIPRAF